MSAARLTVRVMSLFLVVSASEAAITTLPVPASTIFPGQVIAADQLTARDFQTSPRSLRGIATRADEIVGRAAQRRLPAGMPVLLTGLGEPLAIKRGSAAMAVYQEDGFSISATVIALADGGIGDVIDARTTETGAVIRVEVLADGRLLVLGE